MTDVERGLALLAALVTPHRSIDRDGPDPWRPCAACEAGQRLLTPEGQRLVTAVLAALAESAAAKVDDVARWRDLLLALDAVVDHTRETCERADQAHRDVVAVRDRAAAHLVRLIARATVKKDDPLRTFDQEGT